MWSLLLIAGCFYGDARPYDAWLADLDRGPTGLPADTAADTAPPPPDEPPPTWDACSEPGGAPMEVTFVNRTGIVVDLYFVGSDCQPQNTALLARDARETRSTAVGEVWRVRDAFDTLEWVGQTRIDGSTEVEFR